MSTSTEPAADLRRMASVMRQMFIALTNEGFTETQALVLLGKLLQSNVPPAA